MDTAKVERVYTSYAKVYDHIFGKIFHDGREHAVRLLNLSPGERVLEVGVGTGFAPPLFSRTSDGGGNGPPARGGFTGPRPLPRDPGPPGPPPPPRRPARGVPRPACAT